MRLLILNLCLFIHLTEMIEKMELKDDCTAKF